MRKRLRRLTRRGFWKASVVPAVTELDRLLNEARSHFQRLDLTKMLPGCDEVTSAQVALDTAEDTMLALSFYAKRGIGHSEGEKYLRLYGFLQAIHLQQDAIEKLHDLFLGTSLQHSPDSGWRRLRNLRNLTVGHPIEHKRGGMGVKRSLITRLSLETEGFDYQVWIREIERFAFEKVEIDWLFANYLMIFA